MDYVYIAVIGSLIGTISVILVSTYLYILYRRLYMGLWTLTWLLFLIRYFLVDLGDDSWKTSVIGLSLFQFITFVAVLTMVFSTYDFINKPFNKKWSQGAIISFIISVALNFQPLPFSYKLLVPVYTCCIAGVWIGLTFIRKHDSHNIGRIITGYGYLSLSVINFFSPFVLSNSEILPWGYMLGGALRLIIAAGTLILYFEKSKNDLIEKETQYRQLTENSIDIIYHFELFPKFKIKYINSSVTTVTGYEPIEYYRDRMLALRLVHPDDRIILEDFINGLPDSANLPLVIRLIKKDNNTCWIEQICVPIFNNTNLLIAIEGSIRDITYRKRLEQMTFDRMNMVGSMAATVAHEIRNPMTTIRGYLQMLGRKDHYQADADKFQIMIEEVDRANDIIRQYLSLSHQKIASLKEYSLNSIINTLFPLMQADANAHNVAISLDLKNIPEILLDESEIRQLLLNMVRNGIESMPSGGNLIIRTDLIESSIVLSVSDHGTGIPVNIQEQLGTPFFTTKDTGTGLGLSICYQIVARHKATIEIDTSEKGTTFFVKFPQIDKTASK